MPYAAHDTAVRSALRRAGVASAKIDRIIAEESAARIVFAAPITHIITSPGLVKVWLRGWISSMSDPTSHFELHFPPNEPELYLAEIKRAHDSNKFVEGTCVLDPGTNLLVLKEIIVTNIGATDVRIESISEYAVAALHK